MLLKCHVALPSKFARLRDGAGEIMTRRNIAKLKQSGIAANLAPDAFFLWARHFIKCDADFSPPDSFSPVPYFLLCRAIELAIKAFHLINHSQGYVKDTFGHDFFKAYAALPTSKQQLSADELGLLKSANDIYREKDFEYFMPEDVLTAYSRYPDLSRLRQVAEKILNSVPPIARS
jgi:hypothetical protein